MGSTALGNIRAYQICALSFSPSLFACSADDASSLTAFYALVTYAAAALLASFSFTRLLTLE